MFRPYLTYLVPRPPCVLSLLMFVSDYRKKLLAGTRESYQPGETFLRVIADCPASAGC
jgi:hypothetical protein